MCYSGQVELSKRKLERVLGRHVSFDEFEQLLKRRVTDDSIKISRSLEDNFIHPETDAEQRMHASIIEYRKQKTQKLEQELFKQRKRLVDAERSLQTKETKKAREDERIATNKVKWCMEQLADVKRTEPKSSDDRIFPFWYAPVIIMENEKYVIRPMRYHCRAAGKPAMYDRKYPGLYNARRDNLEGFWKDLYGTHHALVVMKGFYENVSLHDFEHRALRPDEEAQNVVLHFKPNLGDYMLVACLWSKWTSPEGETLDSFAAITDEPPPEIAATGHNRCVIPIKPENITAWLSPEGRSKEELARILDDRERPQYEHRRAA